LPATGKPNLVRKVTVTVENDVRTASRLCSEAAIEDLVGEAY
jgi:hypothetical protein